MSKSAEHVAEGLQSIPTGISTKDLVDELAKREGVTEYSCPSPDDGWCLYASAKNSAGTHPYTGDGPARILVVID